MRYQLGKGEAQRARPCGGAVPPRSSTGRGQGVSHHRGTPEHWAELRDRAQTDWASVRGVPRGPHSGQGKTSDRNQVPGCGAWKGKRELLGVAGVFHL